MNLRTLADLMERRDRWRRESDRAAGALQQLKSQLKKEHGLTLEQAEAKLPELETEEAFLRIEAERALLAFEKEYGERIDQ